VSQLAGRQAAAQLEVHERHQLDLRRALAARPRRAMVCAGELDVLERLAKPLAGLSARIGNLCHKGKCYREFELLA
jgi:hypothetical protein